MKETLVQMIKCSVIIPLYRGKEYIEDCIKSLSVQTYSDFELILRPTADFWTPLLSRGAAIKVLQPQWLADEIKQIHQEAARLYE